MRKRLLDIFLKVANKLILRRRAGQRLTKLKKAFELNAITNRKECKKWVAEDWKQAALTNISSDDPSALENIENIRYTMSFTREVVAPDLLFPLEFETNIASFMEKIDAQPVISFDDLEPYETIEQLDFEIEKYKVFDLPPVSSFDPKFSDKSWRPGCEYECAIRQRAGEPDLEKTQMRAHEEMEKLK